MSWYYVKKQKTIGPVKKIDILALIQSNELCAFDLLSNEQGAWQFVYKFESFYNFFKSTPLERVDNKDWVVMKFKEGGGRIQLGPWTTEDVTESINSGAIKYTDLIWCEDMTQWYPITLIEQFNPEVPFTYYKQEVVSDSYDPSKAKPYMIYTPNLPKIDLPPIDAEGESLV